MQVDLHLGYSLRLQAGFQMKNLLCVKNIFQKIKPLWYSKIKVHCLRIAQLVACLNAIRSSKVQFMGPTHSFTSCQLLV